jgi:pimeloyl-ACP methyl ester carboxylesterase
MLLDWPGDIAAAADLLGIDHFAVQGMSAGAPYALACAHRMSERITACSLVSAVPPPEIARRSGPRLRRFAWWVAHRFPNYLRRRLEQFRPDGLPDEEIVRSRMLRVSQWLGGQDEILMHDAELRALLERTMIETQRQGASANRREIERLVRPWGFDVRQIKPARMFLWHGEKKPDHAHRSGAAAGKTARRLPGRLLPRRGTFLGLGQSFRRASQRAQPLLMRCD